MFTEHLTYTLTRELKSLRRIEFLSVPTDYRNNKILGLKLIKIFYIIAQLFLYDCTKCKYYLFIFQSNVLISILNICKRLLIHIILLTNNDIHQNFRFGEKILLLILGLNMF